MLILYCINLIKLEIFWLSKKIGLTYNLEQKEYTVKRRWNIGRIVQGGTIGNREENTNPWKAGQYYEIRRWWITTFEMGFRHWWNIVFLLRTFFTYSFGRTFFSLLSEHFPLTFFGVTDVATVNTQIKRSTNSEKYSISGRKCSKRGVMVRDYFK